jgi:uncharacterized protein (DUF2141 family)
MAFRKFLILILPFLFAGCAQIGQISGGDQDVLAPCPLADKTFPPAKSTFFKGNSFEMTFDEFVQLNNPQQTLFIVPNHAVLKPSIRKKTLKIEWEDTLMANTTYVIYMNGTIKDVSEGNDSLLTYVFSTGDRVDSLQYSVQVIDAWANRMVKDATVGLYTESDSIKPYYFAKTTENGLANFQYLKAGKYKIKAFIDSNKDLEIQPKEALAFRSDFVVLDSTIIDSIPLRISFPKAPKAITTYKFIAPASFVVGTNFSQKKADYFINGQQIDSNNIHQIKDDSVQLFMSLKDVSTAELILKSIDFTDTISMRLTEKEKIAKLNLSPSFNSQSVSPVDEISFLLNDLISTIDTNKISVTDPADSSIVPFNIKYSMNQFYLNLDRGNHQQLLLTLLKGAVKSNEDISDSSSFLMSLKKEKDFGVIHIEAAELSGQIIVELLQGGKVINNVVLAADKKHSFTYLQPGDYSFRVILDQNKNEIWDTGDLKSGSQPENVLWFSSPTKVRANWEVDVSLTPKL